jgi:hypothetical protein
VQSSGSLVVIASNAKQSLLKSAIVNYLIAIRQSAIDNPLFSRYNAFQEKRETLAG